MHIAIITAGGAGMFCGSCMLDNALARALQDEGVEVTLIPTYTPIRTDETNNSTSRVFFGGINVYLDSKFGFWKKLPQGVVRWLNSPRLISLATKLSVSNDAKDLGEMTVQMLDGPSGPQKREVDELVGFLADSLKPDVVLFSNALLSGVMPALRERFDGRVFCMLQGDDIFLDDLVEPWASQALDRIRRNSKLFDGLIAHSDFYRNRMRSYVDVAENRFHTVATGIQLDGHTGTPRTANQPFTVGYFARVCPEKGFEQAVEGFRLFHQRYPNSRMLAAGYLGKRDQRFFNKVSKKARDLGSAFEFCGSPPDRDSKIEFFKRLDVLTVPTIYEEPKGLYVLEALANGVPVVQPRHGAFPELLDRTGGGLLFQPSSPESLADRLHSIAVDEAKRRDLAESGYATVHASCGADAMARNMLEVLSS
ncbi:MAG: glycosyltransferase family 4 protein [Planctomycetaceae bacterium]